MKLYMAVLLSIKLQCVMLCRSLFVHLSYFFWPLCCLSIFDLRIMIAPFGIFKLFLQYNRFVMIFHSFSCQWFERTSFWIFETKFFTSIFGWLVNRDNKPRWLVPKRGKRRIRELSVAIYTNILLIVFLG